MGTLKFMLLATVWSTNISLDQQMNFWLSVKHFVLNNSQGYYTQPFQVKFTVLLQPCTLTSEW